jgi:hypothetical protein
MKKLAFLIAILFAIPAVFAADLSNYPSFFSDVAVVVGNNATTLDIFSANTISNSLNAQGIQNTIALANETDYLQGTNIISVGKNSVTSRLTNDSVTVADGSARIKLYENGSKVQIVAFGNTPEDTKKAAYVLSNWNILPLQTSDIVVSGSIPNITLSKFVTLVDYSCNNQTYGYGRNWTQPCNTTYLEPYFNASPVVVPPGQPGNSTNTTNSTTTPVVTPGASFTASAISFGSSDQHRGENVSTTMALQNTGTVTLTGFTFSAIDAKYKLNFTNVPSSLASGQTATVTVNAYVPLDLDAVDDECREAAMSIGTLTVSASQNASVSQAVHMQAANELSILNVYAEIEGGARKDIDGKTADVHINDNVDVTVELKNRFGSNTDPSMDVKVKATGDTSELDLGTSSKITIDAGDEDTVTLSESVDSDAKGSIRLILTATGIDDNGADYCAKSSVRFNVLTEPTTTTATQNKTQQITYIPLEPNKPVQQTVQPAAQPQPEPRQESVDVITPPEAVVKSSSSTSYTALLGLIIFVLVVVLVTEIVILTRRRKYIDQL